MSLPVWFSVSIPSVTSAAMADPKGNHLLVNLSAAQTRRRLKGFGHGVRKVRSAGKNQALVIHTATGEHLAELERKFADVGSASGGQLDQPVENLRNVSPSQALWLRDVGLRTIVELRRSGAVAAYRRVKHRYPAASRELLWALAAGLQDRDWRELSPAEQQALLDQLDASP
jgi:hypothetical protein